jgi:hypothetical protein
MTRAVLVTTMVGMTLVLARVLLCASLSYLPLSLHGVEAPLGWRCVTFSQATLLASFCSCLVFSHYPGGHAGEVEGQPMMLLMIEGGIGTAFQYLHTHQRHP